MLKNIKTILYLFNIGNIIFFSSLFTLSVNSETKIIANKGDNLIKISKRYGVTIKELMHKNRFNDARKLIEGEVVLIPTKNKEKYHKNQHISYKVVEGDTLYKIARDYNIDLSDIISINNFSTNEKLQVDQIIFLPKGSKYKKSIDNKSIKLASKKVFYHRKSKSEDLSTIAEIHKVTLEEINVLNKLNNPQSINSNIRLKLRDTKSSKWLKYGSLMINWTDWTYFEGNYIAQAKTKKGTSFYLALNCQRRALNNTLINSYWTRWYFPKTDFEYKLINDFCDKDFNF
tara:strand:+ start:91 stop:951 length:861 start_codon:yes stop_codon:yes gene_type:complete